MKCLEKKFTLETNFQFMLSDTGKLCQLVSCAAWSAPGPT